MRRPSISAAVTSAYRLGAANYRAAAHYSHQAYRAAAHYGHQAYRSAGHFSSQAYSAIGHVSQQGRQVMRDVVRPVVRTGLNTALGGSTIGGHANMGPTKKGSIQSELREKTAALGEQGELSRQNVMSLIRLHGASRQAGGAQGVDVGVHGTFDHNAAWTRTGSAEMNALGENRSTLQTNFQWSGSNLESKRQEAGKHLSNFVEDIHKVTGQRSETTLIGHSHGGNVIGHALTHQAAKGRGGVENAVMVGTPMMIDQQGTNVSWTAGGADKVQGQIISSHNNTDQVQTRAAHLNEFANGTTRNFQGSNPNAVVGSGREFHVPGSSTPQINISRRAQTISPVGAHEETHGVDSLREIAGRLPSRPSR